MEPSLENFEASRKQTPCLLADLATNKTSSSTPAPTPPRDDYGPQNAENYNPRQPLNTPLPKDDDEDETRRKLNLRREVPKMAASIASLAGGTAEEPSHTISTASASTVLAEHDEYVRQMNADQNGLPAEFSYKRSKREEKKSKAKYIERREKLKNPSWKAELRELDELAKKLRENQKQWSDQDATMKMVIAKLKTGKKERKNDKDWYEKMRAGPWKASGPIKKLRKSIAGWEEVDIEDDEAEALIERKQLRKRQFSPYNTWRWDELSSSNEAEARERRVVAAAIKMLEKPVDSDEDDEPIVRSLLSDDEAVAASPALRTNDKKLREKAKKQEAELVEKNRQAKEKLRPLLHPFFRGDNHSADHILQAGALPAEVLKQSQFFPVSADIRKAKTELCKQKYEEKMAVKAKKDEAKVNRAARKQCRFEARREKRSAYAHRLAVKGWDFPKVVLTGYEAAIAEARIIPVVVATQIPKQAPTTYKKAVFGSDIIPRPEDSELLPKLPLAPECARNPDWTFPVWDVEMAWTEYDTLPGRFEAISKIIRDDDWNDQFVKGSKLDQELMRTIVIPVWNAMTYEEKTTVLGGQRVDPACFWSDDGDEYRSYVRGSPKMVDPFDIEGSDWISWSHPSESDSDSIKSAGSRQGETTERDSLRPARFTLSTDKAGFDQRENLASESFKAALYSKSAESASSDEEGTNEAGILLPVRTSLSTEKVSFDNEDFDGSGCFRSARSSPKGEKTGFEEEEMSESNSLKSVVFPCRTDKENFNDKAIHESQAIVESVATTPEDSFRNSVETARSPLITEKGSFQEGETNESDSWQSASFSSNIQRESFDQEEGDESSAESETAAPPEDLLVSSAAFDNETAMPRSELGSLIKVVSLSDFEEPLDSPNPDLDLKKLFQRVGAFVTGEEAPECPFNSSSTREAELIFNLLRKEAVVRHWFPERTFSYDNAAWKTRVSIFDPKNKEKVNPAVFPAIAKEIRKDDGIEYFDPERIDLSIPGRNNIIHDRPDMQVNWIGIADEYRLGLNGRQCLTKPEWAKNYDLIRAQQPDPLIYMPKDSLAFDDAGYFSEVLPKPLVFPEVIEETKNYDDAEWIWKKHCMDQRIGLHPCDQRPDPNATISDEGYSGLIGDNLPPEDQSFDTNGRIRHKRSSGAPTDSLYLYGEPMDASGSIRKKRFSGAPSFKMPEISNVPAEVGAQVLKELKKWGKPLPETAALGRPPPEKYIQLHDTPATVLMKTYQEEYHEFRKECPEPASIRFEREVFLEPPVSPEKKAKQELDDYLAQLNDEQWVDFSNKVDDAINKLVATGPYDMPGSLETPVELIEDLTSSVGLVMENLDFKTKFNIDELDMKHAREDTPMAGSEPVTKRPYTPAAPRGLDAGSSGMSVISETLFRRSERYRLRDVGREKPNPRAPSVLSAASGANLNRALDASKARILQKMKERGESAKKQASMAATLDMFKHPESAVPEPEPAPENPFLPCNNEATMKGVQPSRTPMTPAKARAIIKYLIDSAPIMEEDELKENIIHFFGERFLAYAMTRLDLSSVDISEEEANAYLQQRFEAHRLIEEAEEARAKEIKSAPPMSKREAQYLFEATMTPAKARSLLNWAKCTQPSLYIKHMLAPGLLEYCETDLGAAPVAVMKEEGAKFIVWNRKMRESGQDLIELQPTARVNDVRTGEDKSQSKFRASPLISVARGRAVVERLFNNKPNLEVMKLRRKEDLDSIIHAKDGRAVQVTENEAIAFFNSLSKRARGINCAQRDQEEHCEGADEIFPLFKEENQKSAPEEGSVAIHEVDDPKNGSVFEDIFENDPEMSPALAVKLIAWVLDVRPDCNPHRVLGENFLKYVSQYQRFDVEPLEDDKAISILKRYALARQLETGRIKVLHEVPEQKSDKEDDACSDIHSKCSASETTVLEKFPDIYINAPSKLEKSSDTVRLRLKPSQVCEFLEYLKNIHGHCDFKDKGFDRMIKAYIQLPDDAPTKDFPFRGETFEFFKQMVMTQIIETRKKQRAFDEGRVAYAYGAGTDPDIRRESGEEVQDDVEKKAYNSYDDMYDGVARLFGSMSSTRHFEVPRNSFTGSFRGSSGSSLRNSSIIEWPDLPFEVWDPVNGGRNRGLFIRKRVSHAFDQISPHKASTDDGRLHLRRNPSYCSQHEADKNEERSSSPVMSASLGVFGLGLSLPGDEERENDSTSPAPARKNSGRPSLRAPAIASSSPAPTSENSDSDDTRRPLVEGRVSQRFDATKSFPSRAGAETPPPVLFDSVSSASSHEISIDWDSGSNASMTFSQFQAVRPSHWVDEVNMSASFPPHGRNIFDDDAEAYNGGRREEDEELSDMEAYEAWHNARHGVSPEELEEGRRYFAEEQMIDEVPDDPKMLEKILGLLAKIDDKVAEAHAQVVKEATKEEEEEPALSGGVSCMVNDDPAHLLLHAPDPKKEFKNTLLKLIESEHLDAEEIEMLLEKIDERDEPSEYEWVDENGELLEESDWEDESEEEDDIDQGYHVQEHQERMQLNFEQCEYEGALARVKAWRDAHEERADSEFPQREREANEARKAEDKRIKAIIKAWEKSKAPLTIPHETHGRRLKAKALRKEEIGSLGNAQKTQGSFPSEPEALFKKDQTTLLKDENSQDSVCSRRAFERVSLQVKIEDESLQAEHRPIFAENYTPREEEFSTLKSFGSGGHDSKDADIRTPSPTTSIGSASEEVSNGALSRKQNLPAYLGFKSKDKEDVSAPSPTPSIRSLSRGVTGTPSKKMTMTRKPSADVAGPYSPSVETFSPRPSMAPSETAQGPPSLVQRMPSGNASAEPSSTNKSIKARLGFKSKAAPSPTPSFRSVSQDLPRRTSKKLTKKRKYDAKNTRPSTPSGELFSPTPSMTPSESAPRSVSLGLRITSLFKRKDKNEEHNESLAWT